MDPAQSNAYQAVVEKAYRQYYTAILLYGSDDEIREEFGDDILVRHQKANALRKSFLEKRIQVRRQEIEASRQKRKEEREERLQAAEERRKQRQKEREERVAQRQKEREGALLAKNLPLSSFSFGEEEEDPSSSDEETI